ncbi:fusicoccadiene synthase [Pyrenophora seminiperda CCB06]|uniref:geranylgeranyl diphosphate synthase n=1 Tax=Pyrenophora seminiperda CCB06 TaxID=1302712 RepID=A0A3M7M999_9PLEO|nr:fusicoccadiene synthase [Pyrenophora seminiperda CCB06]
MSTQDVTSYLIPLSQYDTQGLCSNYTLRRHKYEAEANAGCHEARSDWIKYIGPIEQFGGCNPLNGNFSAVVLPLCRPERLRLIAYVLEYAFLYDNMIELEQPYTSSSNHHEKQEWKNTNPALGKTQIQAKMMMQLASMDKACTERVKRVWQEMITTTLSDKDKQFASLDEYVDFRIVDTGAPFVEAMLLFGMGITLSAEEDAQLDPIRKPCYAALGLANDYFSFDREYAEFQEAGASKTLTNSVWLHMQWHHVDSDAAKEMTKQATKRYEELFLEMCAEYRQVNAPLEEKLERYLDALAYQVSGNVVWSLNCPRYHPEYRYDPNVGIEDDLTAKALPKTLGVDYIEVNEDRDDDGSSNGSAPAGGQHSRRTSTETFTSVSSDDVSSTDDDYISPSSPASSYSPTWEETKHTTSSSTTSHAQLDSRHARAPFDYITSLPSKGVRDIFIDALNIWLDVPEPIVSRIKALGARLHAASLMLDDIEDGSTLRRGHPVTHTVFGIAQTINSGCFEILQAVNEARQLSVLSAMNVEIVLEQLEELHVGQSYDLYWTHHGICPSEAEYLEMVKKKTGGLFQLLARLLLANGAAASSATSTCHNTNNKSSSHTHPLYADISTLSNLLGTHFQIRDDYQNLHSTEYSAQKGFCEDLDEGKYSFPIIHALTSSYQKDTDIQQLQELLQRRRDVGYLTDGEKRLVLEQLGRAGSMMYTEERLKELQGDACMIVENIERDMGRENWVLRALLQKLEV